MLDLSRPIPDAAANNYYFDVANLHLYSRAADIPRIVGWYRDQLAARGMSKPIWIGETNAIPYDDAIWQASKDELPRHDGRAGLVHHPGVRDLRRARTCRGSA